MQKERMAAMTVPVKWLIEIPEDKIDLVKLVMTIPAELIYAKIPRFDKEDISDFPLSEIHKHKLVKSDKIIKWTIHHFTKDGYLEEAK